MQNTYHPVYSQNHHIKNESDQIIQETNQDATNKISNLYTNNRQDDGDLLKEFSVSKSDPKYQTLPYNTKFTVNLIPTRLNNNKTSSSAPNDNVDNNHVNNNESKEVTDTHQTQSHISNNNALHQTTNSCNNNNVVQSHMTVHSAPLNLLNKNIATPLNQNDLISRKLLEQNFSHTTGENSNAYQNGIKPSLISECHNTTSSSASTPNIPNYQVSSIMLTNPLSNNANALPL